MKTPLAQFGLVLLLALCAPAQQPKSKGRTQSKSVTLWGITMGMPVPDTVCTNLMCGDESAFGPDEKKFEIHGLPYDDGGYQYTSVVLYQDNVDKLESSIGDGYCYPVLQSLRNKLGTPQHSTQRQMNTFGATWTGDLWWWTFKNGTEVVYQRHRGEMSGCFLTVQTAGYIKRPCPCP